MKTLTTSTRVCWNSRIAVPVGEEAAGPAIALRDSYNWTTFPCYYLRPEAVEEVAGLYKDPPPLPSPPFPSSIPSPLTSTPPFPFLSSPSPSPPSRSQTQGGRATLWGRLGLALGKRSASSRRIT
ncbi:hypothetical protein E2C01_063460 [Portunus trituberculatus]|uniref:Uncharacterized protein n=1 Tax=Portunus trituberculatus TaxID=210409 RepID=A0A5B7HDR2_PORTR|nr:hypothetical protein [Portunus trituberculatus]